LMRALRYEIAPAHIGKVVTQNPMAVTFSHERFGFSQALS
jgi:hypothetical protein